MLREVQRIAHTLPRRYRSYRLRRNDTRKQTRHKRRDAQRNKVDDDRGGLQHNRRHNKLARIMQHSCRHAHRNRAHARNRAQRKHAREGESHAT